MARNEEKHYGRLNRLILQKEKEEYEKHHPQRPRLDSLLTIEEIQKWLPCIKKDLDFYLKKSMVTCYSEKHIEECRSKVNNLEKEYKAFVRKITQLSSGTLDAIPWTNRAYKRKNEDSVESKEKKDFVPIVSPILEQEKVPSKLFVPAEIMPLMNTPLSFNLNNKQNKELKLANKASKEDEISCLDSFNPKMKINSSPLSNLSVEQHKPSCVPETNWPVQDRSSSFDQSIKQYNNLKLPDKCFQEDKKIIGQSDFKSLKAELHGFIINEQEVSHVASKSKIVHYDYSSDSDCG